MSAERAAERLYQTLLRDFDGQRHGVALPWARVSAIQQAMDEYAKARDAERRLRPLRASDVLALHALQAECYPASLHDSAEEIERLVCEAAVALGADEEGVLIGAVFVVRSEQRFELYSIEVARKARRRGVASTLIRAALATAPPGAIVAHCTAEGRALLASLGFQPTGGEVMRGGVLLVTMTTAGAVRRRNENDLPQQRARASNGGESGASEQPVDVTALAGVEQIALGDRQEQDDWQGVPRAARRSACDAGTDAAAHPLTTHTRHAASRLK